MYLLTINVDFPFLNEYPNFHLAVKINITNEFSDRKDLRNNNHILIYKHVDLSVGNYLLLISNLV